MFIQYLYLIVGLAMVVLCADLLVDGAASVARRLKISEFVIGLTIVGFGTSCPELVVSLTGAFEGNSSISIGNVIGSNIFNTLLILGVTALVMPITISSSNRRRDIPITLGVTLILIACGMNKSLFRIGQADSLSTIEGIVFLLIFFLYLYYCFKNDDQSVDDSPEEVKVYGIVKSLCLIVLGLVGLIVGGKLFVNSATTVARYIGVSDKFIAITVLAGGTSLPELATCIVAAIKKKGQLALGNILGSNIFNILLILGASAIIHPISLEAVDMIDMAILLSSALLVFISSFSFKKGIIDRIDGIIFLLLFIAYYIWLIVKL